MSTDEWWRWLTDEQNAQIVEHMLRQRGATNRKRAHPGVDGVGAHPVRNLGQH